MSLYLSISVYLIANRSISVYLSICSSISSAKSKFVSLSFLTFYLSICVYGIFLFFVYVQTLQSIGLFCVIVVGDKKERKQIKYINKY